MLSLRDNFGISLPAGATQESASFDAIVASARAAIGRGDALSAVDLLDGMPAEGHSTASRQVLALALLRAGALSRAREEIARLAPAAGDDEETLGLVAREAKARWQAGESAAIYEARDAYLHAFRKTGGFWTGINAATSTLVCGDLAAARDLAADVIRTIERSDAARADFWAQATLAEALLLRGAWEAAAQQYARAVSISPRAYGHLRSVRDNALTILAELGQPAALVSAAFPRVTVAAFTGHILDAPGRREPRFPASDEERVAGAILERIDEFRVGIGVAAAACGADILFLEALAQRDCPFHIVLPFPAAAFRQTSVLPAGGERWGARFDAVLAAAEEVTVLAPGPGGDLSHQFQGEVCAGFARLRACALGGHAIGLAFFDGRSGALGGTASVLAEWNEHGLETHVIPCGAPGDALPGAARNWRCDDHQRTVAILFADAVGFSRLDEHVVLEFMQSFWAGVASVLRGLPAGAVHSANTWGDALYLVANTVTAAAQAALDLARFSSAGTPLRIALHAGPAWEVDEPVTGRKTMAGTHVNRAARMEPVTPPGLVYVSEAFAALLALDDNESQFSCEYVGTVPLAKGYGRQRTYKLTRR